MCSADQCNSNHSKYSANTDVMYAKINSTGYESLNQMNKVSYVKSTIGYGGI